MDLIGLVIASQRVKNDIDADPKRNFIGARSCSVETLRQAIGGFGPSGDPVTIAENERRDAVIGTRWVIWRAMAGVRPAPRESMNKTPPFFK